MSLLPILRVTPHPMYRFAIFLWHSLFLSLFLGMTACTPSTHISPQDIPLNHQASGTWRENLRQSSSPSILFIGNSYTMGVPAVLRDIAREHGLTIQTTEVTHGGWTLHQHADSPDTLETIRRGGWDLVILQEQSQRLSHPEPQRAKQSYPAIRKLAAEACAVEATPVLYRTWGRLHGDPDLIKRGQPDSFSAMHERLTQGYLNAAKTAGDLPILPVGDAWAREVEAGRGQRLYRPDGSHPTQVGIRLNAQTIFDTCFPQFKSTDVDTSLARQK